MSFEVRGETVIGAMNLDDLKVVYRVLHAHLAKHPELMDGSFLIELQDFLHAQARAAGVDATDHGRWDEWLGNTRAPSCHARLKDRRAK